MNTATVLSHFRRIGTDLRIRPAAPPQGEAAYWWEPPISPSLEATADGTFLLSLPPPRTEEFEMSVLIVRSGGKGSLALTLWSGRSPTIHSFLCGAASDGRWFAKPLTAAPSSYRAA